MRNKPGIILMLLILIPLISTITLIANANVNQPDSRVTSYDISQWQGPVSNDQASGLKQEVHFMILKAENGSLYKDPQFSHTARELSKNHVPYGAYDYSIYNGPYQAVAEASMLYRRAPKANFYVNDCEENNAGNELDTATQAWSDEMHQLTKKPVVLYSDLSFINGLSQVTRNTYDALWVADYGNEPDPAWHYDLWQFTDRHYSPALNQYVDASIVPYGGRSITYWTRSRRNLRKRMHKSVIHRRKSTKHPGFHHVNYEYYQSHNVRHLLVTHKSGINLYDLDGKYLRHVKRGTVLHVNYFRRYPYVKHTDMTRAVDYLWHRWVMYTARKSRLIPYYFRR